MRINKLMGKKRQARKRLAKQRQENVEVSNKVSDSDWFIVSGICVAGFIGLHLISLTEEAGTYGYYHIQNGLFVLSCLFILVFVASKDLNIQIYESVKKAIQMPNIVDRRDLGNILAGITYVISLITLFIVDLSFFSNYGLRISGVVAVNIYVLLRHLFYARK